MQNENTFSKVKLGLGWQEKLPFYINVETIACPKCHALKMKMYQIQQLETHEWCILFLAIRFICYHFPNLMSSIPTEILPKTNVFIFLSKILETFLNVVFVEQDQYS